MNYLYKKGIREYELEVLGYHGHSMEIEEHLFSYKVKINTVGGLLFTVRFVYGGYTSAEDELYFSIHQDNSDEEITNRFNISGLIDSIRLEIESTFFELVKDGVIRKINEVKAEEDKILKRSFEIVSVEKCVEVPMFSYGLVYNVFKVMFKCEKNDAPMEVVLENCFGDWRLVIQSDVDSKVVEYYGVSISRRRKDLFDCLCDDDRLKFPLLFSPRVILSK